MTRQRILVFTVALALAASACGGGGRQAETKSAPQSTTSAVPAPAATTTTVSPTTAAVATTQATTTTAASTTTTTVPAPDGEFVPPVGGATSESYDIPTVGEVPSYYPIDVIPVPPGGFMEETKLSFIDIDTSDERGPTLTVSADIASDLSRDELADFYRTTLADLGWEQTRDDFVEQENGTTAQILFFFDRDEATPYVSVAVDVVDFASRDDRLVDVTVGFEDGEGLDDWPYFGSHAEQWFAGSYLPGLPETDEYQFQVNVSDFFAHNTRWSWDVPGEVDELFADVVAQFPFGAFEITDLLEHPEDKYDNFWMLTFRGGGIEGQYVLGQGEDSRTIDIWLEYKQPRF